MSRLSPERETLLRRGGKLEVADREALLGEIDYLRGQLEEQTFRTSDAVREVAGLKYIRLSDVPMEEAGP